MHYTNTHTHVYISTRKLYEIGEFVSTYGTTQNCIMCILLVNSHKMKSSDFSSLDFEIARLIRPNFKIWCARWQTSRHRDDEENDFGNSSRRARARFGRFNFVGAHRISTS